MQRSGIEAIVDRVAVTLDSALLHRGYVNCALMNREVLAGMKLEDAILGALNRDGDEIIFARKPWSRTSEAIFDELNEDCTVPSALLAEGYCYFLEGYLVREILDARAKRLLSETQMVDMIMYYGTHDGFPDWANALLSF